jgi:hypothetical protein
MPVIQVGRANMTEVISHYNRSWDFNLDFLGFAVWPKKLVTTFGRFGIDHSSAGCVKSISWYNRIWTKNLKHTCWHDQLVLDVFVSHSNQFPSVTTLPNRVFHSVRGVKKKARAFFHVSCTQLGESFSFWGVLGGRLNDSTKMKTKLCQRNSGSHRGKVRITVNLS